LRFIGPAVLVLGLAASAPQSVAPYVARGDVLARKDSLHAKRLKSFFDDLRSQVRRDAPALLSRLEPPVPTPIGYQLLPQLLPERAKRPITARILLSRFSWARTDALLDRDRSKLDSLEHRLRSTTSRSGYASVVEQYKKLVSGQKLIENQIQYNRFWQGEFALHPERYRNVNALERAAMERQALKDSIAADARLGKRLQPKVDSIGRLLEAEIRKYPTPSFVRVEHPSARQWIVRANLYTDITDSGFVDRFRAIVENAWHVIDGGNDYELKLSLRRIPPELLYPGLPAPKRGDQIDVIAHIGRFPGDGIVLTTGGKTTHAQGRGIVLSPHAIPPSTLAHEIAHPLGFKDGYFRSYENRGAEGFEILEVILGPADGVPAPEGGWVRREQFEQMIQELLPNQRR
jgi:hypothetical protein